MRKIFKTTVASLVSTAMIATLALSVGAPAAEVSAAEAATLQPWSFTQTGTSTCGWNKWEDCYFTSVTTPSETLGSDSFKRGTIYPDGNSSDQGEEAKLYSTPTTNVSTEFAAVIGNNGWSGEYEQDEYGNSTLVGNNPYTLSADMKDVEINIGHFYTLTYTVGWEGTADVAKDADGNLNPNGATKTKGIRTTLSDSYTNTLSFLEGSDDMDIYVTSGETKTVTYKFACYASGAKLNISLQMGAFLMGDGTGLDTIETNAKGTVTIKDFKLVDEGEDPDYIPEKPTDAPTTVAPTTKPTVKPTTTQAPTQKVKKPARVKKVTAKNLKGKKVKVTWKKVSGATKYQVKVGAKKKTTKKTKYTMKGLKKNKKYKVYVRAYNKAGYGKWSKVKKVKVTK